MNQSEFIGLPMFPLSSVVFPYAGLPLQVFESRYKKMMQKVLGGDQCFGTALIVRGSETGGGDTRSDIGVRVRILEADQRPDGGWTVFAAGIERISISRWLTDDPYPSADCSPLNDENLQPDATPLLNLAAERLRVFLQSAAQLGFTVPSSDFELVSDPEIATWQLCTMSPMGPMDRQILLAELDPSRRLELFSEMMEDQLILLHSRIRPDDGPQWSATN